MTLSLTCPCGARLEIDEKFAGKSIQCPDCNRPLSTVPPAPEPAQTSVLAIAALVLVLIGAFTLVGTVAAVVCGALALSRIRRSPEPIGGACYARAAIILGVAFTLVTVLALFVTDLLRIDGFLRTIEVAGKFVEAPEEVDIFKSDGFGAGRSATIRRPSPSWVKLVITGRNDDLILANLWDDAYIVCLCNLDGDQSWTLENCRQEGQQRFLQSDLVTKILNRSLPDSPPPSGQDRDRKQLPGTEIQEFVLDVRLGGVDRTFLIRVLRERNRLHLVAGGTRKSRFARLQPEFVKALDSYKLDK
jgi:hypothetical protein